jgi:hypothetical protein
MTSLNPVLGRAKFGEKRGFGRGVKIHFSDSQMAVQAIKVLGEV